jgi:ABC-2 type transport system ATP-binding protein
MTSRMLVCGDEMTQGAPAIEFDGLVKHYGAVQALRGVDLEVRAGEVFGFLGPNGAGKTTAIRVMLDLIRPTAGRVAVFGFDAQRDSVEVRRRVGYLPSDPQFPSGMTARAYLDYLHRVRGAADDAYRRSLVDRLELDESRKVSELSRGNRQKVGLVASLIARPELVVLDEPTTGLDPLVQAEVESILREVAADGRTVFFSSHVLEEVESICSRAAVVRQGRIIDVFDLAEQRRLAPQRVDVTFAEPVPAAAFAGLPPGIRVVAHENSRVSFDVRDGIDALVKCLAERRVESLVARQATLEELFLRYYRPGEEEAAS